MPLSMESNFHLLIFFFQANHEVYNTAFALLHEATQSHLPIQPSRFLIDFEKAL